MVADTVLYCCTAVITVQAKAIFVWYPKERGDLKAIHEDDDVLADDELVLARGILRGSRYGCLYIRNEYPCESNLLNYV